MAAGQRLSLKIKVEQCLHCPQANKAALKRHEISCKAFKETGQYPKIKNGQCSGNPQGKAVKHVK